MDTRVLAVSGLHSSKFIVLDPNNEQLLTHQQAPANTPDFLTQPFRDISDVKKLQHPLQGLKYLGRKSQETPTHPLCCLPCAMPYNSLAAASFPGLLSALHINARSLH